MPGSASRRGPSPPPRGRIDPREPRLDRHQHEGKAESHVRDDDRCVTKLERDRGKENHQADPHDDLGNHHRNENQRLNRALRREPISIKQPRAQRAECDGKSQVNTATMMLFLSAWISGGSARGVRTASREPFPENVQPRLLKRVSDQEHDRHDRGKMKTSTLHPPKNISIEPYSCGEMKERAARVHEKCP